MMLRVLLLAVLAGVATARLLRKSAAKMRVAQVPVPIQIPLQVPMLVPMGGPMTEDGHFVSPIIQGPMPFMLNTGPGPELDGPDLPEMDNVMQMDAPFGNAMFANPGFQTPGQLITENEGAEQNAVARSSSTSVNREQVVETLKNGTKQLRTVETRCQNGKCQKKETVQVLKPTKVLNTKAKAAQATQRTVPAANVGPSPSDTALAAGYGPATFGTPSIEDVLHQVMGFGRDIGNMEALSHSQGVPRFPFAAEGLSIKMPQGPGVPAAPLNLKHLDDEDQILGTLPKNMSASDFKVDQSGHVVTVQYRMHTGHSKVGVEQRFSLDFTPAEKPKAKYNKASGKFSVAIRRPKNAQRSSSDVEVVMDDEVEPSEIETPVASAKQATHSLKNKHQKHSKKAAEELESAKKHMEAALNPKAEPIIMLEFSS